jgi:hypothetical protein
LLPFQLCFDFEKKMIWASFWATNSSGHPASAIKVLSGFVNYAINKIDPTKISGFKF